MRLILLIQCQTSQSHDNIATGSVMYAAFFTLFYAVLLVFLVGAEERGLLFGHSITLINPGKKYISVYTVKYGPFLPNIL